MTTPATDEEQGRLVLAAFKHYGLGNGDPLLVQNISAYAWLHRSIREVATGIDFALNQKWIIRSGEGHIALTADGLKATV